MKGSHLFSFSFDSGLLLKDYKAVQSATQLHHSQQNYTGEWSGIPLRRPKSAFMALDAGNAEQDQFVNTEQAIKTAYVEEVLSFFECEKTSVRFLKLTPGSVIKPHSDERLSFFVGYVRLHIPVLTNDKVEFVADGEGLKMQPGECWFADFSRTHSVANRGDQDRVHLIIDLIVNDWLTELFIKEGIVAQDEQPPDPMDAESEEFKLATVKALLEQNTEATRQLANDMIERYQLDHPLH